MGQRIFLVGQRKSEMGQGIFLVGHKKPYPLLRLTKICSHQLSAEPPFMTKPAGYEKKQKTARPLAGQTAFISQMNGFTFCLDWPQRP